MISDRNAQADPHCFYNRVLLIIPTWIYIQFFVRFYDQIWQDGRPELTGITLQVVITLPQLGHMTNIYDFISTSTSLKIDKLVGMVVQYALKLVAGDSCVITSKSLHSSLWFYVHYYKA